MIIKELLDYPKECENDAFISKTMIFEEGNLNSRDKTIFTESVEKIRWIYNFNENNIRISPYEDNIRVYEEVQIFNILLKKDKNIERIADIISRTIPYPLLLVFELKNKIKLFVAHQREHLSDSSKITLDDLISTNWIDLDNLDDIDKKLSDSLKLDNLSFSNFYKFYSDIVDNIIIYNGSKSVGRDLAISNKLSSEEIKAINDEITNIDKDIILKTNACNKETQFNKQIELNIEINNLEEKKEELKNKLI